MTALHKQMLLIIYIGLWRLPLLRTVHTLMLLLKQKSLTTCLPIHANELGPVWQNIAGNYCIPWRKEISFSYSDPGDTLENKLNNLKPLYNRKKSFAFQNNLKKMLLHWRQILPTRINNNHRILICVSRTIHDLSVWNKPLIDTCQNCSTSPARIPFLDLGLSLLPNQTETLIGAPNVFLLFRVVICI